MLPEFLTIKTKNTQLLHYGYFSIRLESRGGFGGALQLLCRSKFGCGEVIDIKRDHYKRWCVTCEEIHRDLIKLNEELVGAKTPKKDER